MNEQKSSEVHIGETIVKSSNCEKVIVIKIDLKLHFWLSYLGSMENCEH